MLLHLAQVCGLLAHYADYIGRVKKMEMEEQRAYMLRMRPNIERRMRTCKVVARTPEMGTRLEIARTIIQMMTLIGCCEEVEVVELPGCSSLGEVGCTTMVSPTMGYPSPCKMLSIVFYFISDSV